MLSKTYNAQDVEQKLYQQWEDSGLFEHSGDGEPFAIMMPPPNVTGNLHVGHALDNTLPDILVRRARMRGLSALYQPGTDHASIAVHVVLDRHMKAEGTNRFDLGREKFLERAWAWKHDCHKNISSQLRRLGISCAWQRERFTLDEGLSQAVEYVFIELYNRGLIYRGQRLVNWDPNMQTSVSDLEVKHHEVNGHLWQFKYPYADGFTYKDLKTGQDDGIVIATTRPETILADGAIALHPKDPRAKDLVGKKVVVPIVNREIPIIPDDYVDPDFGSGMVKITAAHDFNDFDVYKRHKDSYDIPLINLMTPEAKMNENCPADYVGLDRFDARKKVIDDFKKLGLFIKEEAYAHSVPHAERDNTILEPYLTDQWFVKAGPLAKKCLQAADDKEVNFINPRDEKIYRHWLNHIQDWCISRQLWWGHRIPAWYRDGEIKVQAASPGAGWVQDEDVLDTWFSSALWPMSTLGWPEKTPQAIQDFETFFPQAAMMPGRDILTFWVIRMMMMAKEFTGKSPFQTVYTHAMILDEHGQKMSKSKGNVMDPIGLMDKYGTDALRYTLVHHSAIGQDIRLSEKMVETGRNFCTKLWNASRYALMNEVSYDPAFSPEEVAHPVNRWIISELKNTFAAYDGALDAYRFNEAAQLLYKFIWTTFCDWYLELTKPLIYGDDEALKAEAQRTIGWVLEHMLRLAHPVMPFITEEIWQALPKRSETRRSHAVASAKAENLTEILPATQYLMTQNWPDYKSWPSHAKSAEDMAWLMNVITAIRNARSENGVPPKTEIAAHVRHTKPQDDTRLKTYQPLLEALAKTSGFKTRTEEATQTDALAVAEGFEIILPLEGIVDFEAEQKRIEKEIQKHEAELQKIEGMLGNKSFVERAPAHVVTSQQARKEQIEGDLQRLKGAITP